MPNKPHSAPSRSRPETHQRGLDKVSRIPVKVEPTAELLRKTVNDPDPLIRYATLSVTQFSDPEFVRDLALPRLRECPMVPEEVQIPQIPGGMEKAILSESGELPA